MKRLITTNETATSWSPYKAETKKFQQDMNSEVFAALIQAIVGSTYSTSVPYVVDGCVISGGGPYSITAGKIFYGGEYYSVPSASGLTGTMEFKLENSATAPADPTQFSDGTNHDIHLDYHYTPKSSGTAGTDFSATDLVYLNNLNIKLNNEVNSTTQNTTSTSYADLTSGTASSYTTPNDGKTRTWLITYKGVCKFSGSAGDGGKARIYNATSSTSLDSSESYMDILGTNVDLARMGIYCQKIASIAPNSTIKIQIASTNGGGIDFENNSFVMVEL